MKLSLIALVLAFGTPLPSAEALEEDAIVEVTKEARRDSSLERQKTRVLPAPVPAPPKRPRVDVSQQQPSSDPDISPLFCRPPPAQ